MKKCKFLLLVITIIYSFIFVGCGSSSTGLQNSESSNVEDSIKNESVNIESEESTESEGESSQEQEKPFTLNDLPSSMSVGTGVSIPLVLPEGTIFQISSTTNEDLIGLVAYDGENITVSKDIGKEFSFNISLTNEKYNQQKEIVVTVRVEKIKLNKTFDLFLNSADGDKNIEILKDLGLFRGVNKNTVYSAKFIESGNSISCVATEKGVTLEVSDELFGEWDIILSMNGEEIEFRVAIITKAISTAEELVNFKSYAIVTDEGISPRDNGQVYKMDGFFTLANNIDFRGYRTTQNFSFAPWACEKGGTDWGLIGTFDGRNYTIYGGYYSESGIFGCIGDGAVVKNLAIVNATVEGDRKGVLAREIRNCLIENVLIDVTSVRYEVNSVFYNLSNGGAIGSLIYNATLKNVVVYFPLNGNESNGALANHVDCKAENVYVISNKTCGVSSDKIEGTCFKFAHGTICDEIDFVGFGDNWIFTGEKAEFVSTGNFLF